MLYAPGMEWSALGTWHKVAAVVVTIICFGAVFYVFFWNRIPWLKKK